MADTKHRVALTGEEIDLLVKGLGAIEVWGHKHQVAVALRARLLAVRQRRA